MADSNAKKLAQLLDSNGDVKLSNLDNVSTDLVDDTTPQLGGDLDGNGNTINLNTNTDAQVTPVGTTAQRSTETQGSIRFNTTTSLMEYYDGSNWKSIDSPPTVDSVDVSDFDTAGDTITVTGTNFASGATVKLVGADGTEYSASSVTVTNTTTLSFDITADMLTDNDPFDILVTNPSGLAATGANLLDYAPTPAFTVASGTLATIYDGGRSSISITTGATSDDADDTITYAVTTGSLPSGLSISSTTGTITGSTSAVGSDTTTTFTITATATSTEDSGTVTNSRSYSIVQKAPTITTYTSSSGTFAVPSGVSTVDVLVIGGGGSGAWFGGGGGAGGLIYRPAFPVTPGGTISYSVGNGGPDRGPYPAPAQNHGIPGQNSTFGTLTAVGGGAGGTRGPGTQEGAAGGSGGGAGSGSGGPGTQPSQPGDSSTYGFGNPGGANGSGPSAESGGGGGGAGGTGGQGSTRDGGDGGSSKSYSISGSSVAYAGGGGGGVHEVLGAVPGPNYPGAPGGGGAGAGSIGPSDNGGSGYDATANRGSGGGGASTTTGAHGGDGGSGVIIVKY